MLDLAQTCLMMNILRVWTILSPFAMFTKIRSANSFALTMNAVNLPQARLTLTFAPSAVGSCNKSTE
jgi:hypothetical protein